MPSCSPDSINSRPTSQCFRNHSSQLDLGRMPTFQFIYWSLFAVLVLIVVPILMVWTMIDHFRGRGSDRSGSGGISAGIGAAMQELDRIMTRPSVEHQVEIEQKVLKREDDSGGDPL
jgi:hypothetical protein